MNVILSKEEQDAAGEVLGVVLFNRATRTFQFRPAMTEQTVADLELLRQYVDALLVSTIVRAAGRS